MIILTLISRQIYIFASLLSCINLNKVLHTHALSSPISSPTSFYDRFRALCPADSNCIHKFNPSLLESDAKNNDIWVAVYRSSNNLPSVFLKDDFQNAMNIATSAAILGNSEIETKEGRDMAGKDVSGVSVNTPVAVGRLRSSGTNKWIIDMIRCSLKKENTDPSCDGGSEHTEALSICIDELIIEHLKRQMDTIMSRGSDDDDLGGIAFEGILRCKASLVAAPLFEARGFNEVTKLSQDMATHTSSLDASMERYAARAADFGNDTVAKSPGARDRALQILSLLGQLDLEREKRVGAKNLEEQDSSEDDIDPWRGVTQFYR